MNLSKLFEMQRKLDERIVREKGLEGHNLLAKKILALQVELGELCNCWRGFKFWSNDQKPRTELWKDCNFCGGRGFVSPANYPYGYQRITCIECRGESQFKTNPLLEEYVDCLHFILSIGLDINHDYTPKPGPYPTDMTKLFINLNHRITNLFYFIDSYGKAEGARYRYQDIFDEFLFLGELLGFSYEQIEQAYLQKNTENHRRQEVGY